MNLLSFYLFVLGMGTLLPWNAFITAAGYFSWRFCDTDYEKSFENYFTFINCSINVTVLLFTVKYPHVLSKRTRTLAGAILSAICFVMITLLVYVDIPGSTYFLVTIGTIVCAAFGSGIFQSGLFEYAGLLPPHLMQSAMAGQGFSGVAVSGTNFVISWLAAGNSDNNGDTSDCHVKGDNQTVAVLFFGLAAFTLVCTAFIFLLFENDDAVATAKQEPLLQDNLDSYTAVDLPTSRGNTVASNDSYVVYSSENDKRRTSSVYELTEGVGKPQSWQPVFKLVWPYFTAVAFIFLVTLGVFPSVTTKIMTAPNSPNNRFFTDLWVPFSFVNFAMSDFIGRSLVQMWPESGANLSKTSLLWSSAIRIILIPALILCYTSDNTTTVFNGNIWPIALVSLLGLSSGHVATLLMMHGPKCVEEENQGLAGNIMNTGINVGLTTGAAISFLFIPLTV